jgi:hypothetical protein
MNAQISVLTKESERIRAKEEMEELEKRKLEAERERKESERSVSGKTKSAKHSRGKLVKL